MCPTSGDIAMQSPNSGNLLLRNIVVVASSLSSSRTRKSCTIATLDARGASDQAWQWRTYVHYVSRSRI